MLISCSLIFGKLPPLLIKVQSFFHSVIPFLFTQYYFYPPTKLYHNLYEIHKGNYYINKNTEFSLFTFGSLSQIPTRFTPSRSELSKLTRDQLVGVKSKLKKNIEAYQQNQAEIEAAEKEVGAAQGAVSQYEANIESYNYGYKRALKDPMWKKQILPLH